MEKSQEGHTVRFCSNIASWVLQIFGFKWLDITGNYIIKYADYAPKVIMQRGIDGSVKKKNPLMMWKYQELSFWQLRL